MGDGVGEAEKFCAAVFGAEVPRLAVLFGPKSAVLIHLHAAYGIDRHDHQVRSMHMNIPYMRRSHSITKITQQL